MDLRFSKLEGFLTGLGSLGCRGFARGRMVSLVVVLGSVSSVGVLVGASCNFPLSSYIL